MNPIYGAYIVIPAEESRTKVHKLNKPNAAISFMSIQIPENGT